MKRFCTDFFIPRSSFLTGMASAFNLAGNFYKYNFPKNSRKADRLAMYLDFAVTGQDLWNAMHGIKEARNISDKQLPLPLDYVHFKK